ncbi:MAG: hypothetical protein C0180_01660 [Aciduliprofundum sp.]|nr:MAG: hypothetical protein C0180_01660 [Aciduliprofundum sp.]
MATFDEYVRNGRIKFRDYIMNAKDRGINENIFAESLTALIRSDPWDFMNRTEIEPIRGLLKEIIKKVSSGTGSSVYMLDTYMGGGKTHTMAFIYFMFTKRDYAKNLDSFNIVLKEINVIDLPPVEVIAVDGNDLNDKLPLNEQKVFRDFLGKTGTREEVIGEINRREKPVVFLIDEILDYLDKRGEKYPQDLAYLKTLVEGISETEKSVIVISFPNIKSDKYEKYRVSNIDIYDTLQRKGKSYVPIGDQENFAKVLKKQIFEYIDSTIWNEINSYIGKVLTKERLNYNLKEYQEYFPFHPMLVKLIYERLSSFEGFQKTRGGIKILAHASVDLYRRIINGEKMDSPFFTIGDIDLANEDVKPLLAKDNVFGIHNLEVIINTDIKNEKPDFKKILTNVYLYSLFPDKDKRGIKPSDIYISLLKGTLSIESIEKMLTDSLENKIYLDKENSTGKFYFKPEPSIYAMIKSYQSELSQKDDVIKEYLKRILKYNDPEINATVIVDIDNLEINDKKLFIGALSPEVIRKTKKKSPEDIAREIFDEIGQKSNSSINNVVLLVPSLINIEVLEEDANRYNAVIYYEKDFNKKKQNEKDKTYYNEIIDKINEEKKKIEQSLTNRVMKYYSNVFYIKRDNLEKKEIKDIDKEEDFRAKILELLIEDEKAYTSEGIKNMNIDTFFRELLGNRSEYNISDALRNIKKSTALPYLTEKAFDKAVKDGVKEGLIGYRLGEGGEVHYREDLPTFNYSGSILSKDLASRLKPKSQPTIPTVTPVSPEPTVGTSPNLLSSEFTEIEESITSYDQAKRYFPILRAIDYRWGKYRLHIEFDLKDNGSIKFDLDSDKVPELTRLVEDLFRISGNTIINVKLHFKREQVDYYKENWKRVGEIE